MKWTYDDPKQGDIRTIKRFLLFPKGIDGERRWLCFVEIMQKFEKENWADDGWHDVCFID